MTPDKIPKPSTFENYDITDLNSGDETDDDEAPRKKIPEWALGNIILQKMFITLIFGTYYVFLFLYGSETYYLLSVRPSVCHKTMSTV